MGGTFVRRQKVGWNSVGKEHDGAARGECRIRRNGREGGRERARVDYEVGSSVPTGASKLHLEVKVDDGANSIINLIRLVVIRTRKRTDVRLCVPNLWPNRG